MIWTDECCGTCGSHRYAETSIYWGDRYVCACRASPYYEEITDYDDFCDEYHERGKVPDFED